MSYYASGGQNGGTGRGGNPQSGLLSGPPQLFVNPNQLQFQPGTQNFTFSQSDNSQNQLQLNTGVLLQPPVNFVTDQLGLGQLISQAAQNQQNLQNIMNLGLQMGGDQQSQSANQQAKQRVFTGTVTKTHDNNFGFIDEEVFFQMGVVKGPVLPKEGDRVLVEADFNPSMPFKWNATRVQIVNLGVATSQSQQHQAQQASYQLSYPTSIAPVQKAAPPPPSISTASRAQTVSIVSNPHSAYASGPRPIAVPIQDPRRSNQMMGQQMSLDAQQMMSNVGLYSTPAAAALPPPHQVDLSQANSSSSRADHRSERDRKERERPRERSKERPRERVKERDVLRDRSRERIKRSRSTSRPRERRRRSPSPKRRPREDRERERERDKVRDRSVERVVRKRSLSPVVRSVASERADRIKRSRSRDTVKSADAKSTSNDKGRSVSPKRKPIIKPVARYTVETPKFSLDALELNIVDLKRRYPNLYVPSDFFLARASWLETFPLHKPFELGKPCPFHIYGRYVHRIEVPDPQGIHERFKQVPNVLDAPDTSSTFKVKVMLLSSVSMENIYKKTGCKAEDSATDKDKDGLPLLRLMNFVVGVKCGKQEVLALGGNWSPSLDGANPQSDNQVLINTAIRTVKALAAIDLTLCKYWYRFMELYYRRGNGNLETVVYFLPDLSSCVPDESEWGAIRNSYYFALHGEPMPKIKPDMKKKYPSIVRKGAAAKLKDGDHEENAASDGEKVGTTQPIETPSIVQDKVDEEAGKDNKKVDEFKVPKDSAATGAEGAIGSAVDQPGDLSLDDAMDILRMEVVDECNGDDTTEDGSARIDTSFDIYDDIVEVHPEIVGQLLQNHNKSLDVDGHLQPDGEGKDSSVPEEMKKVAKPLGIAVIDPRNMNVAKLREELSKRSLSTKGLKAQLTTRLVQALEEEKDTTPTATNVEGQEEPEDKATTKTTVTLTTTITEKGEDAPLMTDGLGKGDKEETDEIDSTEETSVIRLVDPATIMEDSIVDELPDSDLEEEVEEVKPNGKMEDGEILDESSVEAEKKLATFTVEGSEKGIFPIVNSKMNLQEKKMWERRYSLPKTPKLIVQPSGTVKGVPFDCSSMSLSSLKDYRIVDRKEDSFEVSLFSEFFYEMLQRDFAFRIYREIVKQSGKLSVRLSKDQKEDMEKEPKELEPALKKRKTSNASNIPGETVTEKSITVDPLLLLSFLFFDQAKSGYITEVDMEEICAALGIGLTRSQVRKLIQKVSVKGSVYYRKWTDVQEAEATQRQEQNIEDQESIKRMAEGNKSLLPIFTYCIADSTLCDATGRDKEEPSEQLESVVVNVDGQSVDVRKVINQLEKGDKERLAAEANANVLKNSLNEAKNQATELKKSNDSLKDELTKTKDALKKLETCDKSNREDLEIFKRATERFIERVKDKVKLPSPIKDKERESSSSKVTSGKDKERTAEKAESVDKEQKE